MAANTNPIFGLLGAIQWALTVITANTGTDLTGAGTSYLVFTADATNGHYIEKLVFRSLGSNVATVCRVWINNGSTIATGANSSLLKEITLPATTVSQIAALTDQELPLGFALPPGYRIYVTLGTTVAAGYDIVGIGAIY